MFVTNIHFYLMNWTIWRCVDTKFSTFIIFNIMNLIHFQKPLIEAKLVADTATKHKLNFVFFQFQFSVSSKCLFIFWLCWQTRSVPLRLYFETFCIICLIGTVLKWIKFNWTNGCRFIIYDFDIGPLRQHKPLNFILFLNSDTSKMFSWFEFCSYDVSLFLS